MNVFEVLPFFQGQKTNVKRVTVQEIEQNEDLKRVRFPKPILPFHVPTFVNPVKEGERSDNNRATPPRAQDEQYFPLLFRGELEKHFYLLPYEPMVNISGGNHIIKRTIAKPQQREDIGGTIKERWSSKDYEITITGALHGSILTGNVDDCFPATEFTKLGNYLKQGGRIEVLCPVFELLNIHYIIIEDITFPFTKGENVQAYEIKAYSDSPHKVLMELDENGNTIEDRIEQSRHIFFN